jgi:hypothetical protein
LDFASGVDPNPAVTLSSFGTSTGLNASGSASGYLEIVGGSAASQFIQDTFLTVHGLRDMQFQDTFCPNGAPGCLGGVQVGDWQFLSSDPVQAAVIPEPGSLALLGAALLGMIPLLRRRKKRA